MSPFHFDGSYANLFPTLVSGGTVVIRPRDALLYPRTFFNTVADERSRTQDSHPVICDYCLPVDRFPIFKDSTLK